MSFLLNQFGELLQQLIADYGFVNTEEGRTLLSQTANVIAARKQLPEIITILNEVSFTPAQAKERLALRDALLTSFGNELKRAGLDFTALNKQADAKLLSKIEKYFNQAKQTASDSNAQLSEQTAAIAHLSYGGYEIAHAPLLNLLDARQPREIQAAAVNALSVFRNQEIAEQLLERYQTITPSVRVEIVNALLA